MQDVSQLAANFRATMWIKLLRIVGEIDHRTRALIQCKKWTPKLVWFNLIYIHVFSILAIVYFMMISF